MFDDAAGSATNDCAALGFSRSELDEISDYLEREYNGVFDNKARDWHLSSHVGFDFARYAVEVIRASSGSVRRILDVGCGFGSFVLCAREAGWEAHGLELGELEVRMARSRLRRLRPQDDPDTVYECADATELAVQGELYDAVTLWNVIEHIENCGAVLAASARLLKPGGWVHIICPSYLAWRAEAHYQVPWYPWMAYTSRARVSEYLRSLGKEPYFFETSIYRRTNWGVQKALRGAGFEVFDLLGILPLELRWRHVPRQIRYLRRIMQLLNPLRPAVEVAGRKRYE